MTETKINVVKQWAINAKSFSVVEVIEHLEKENADLKAQIEKMKNCENCKYNYKEDGEEYCESPNGVCKRYSTNFDMDNWECK